MTLYAVTMFLSAFLLFQVQPLIAKMILPWFGGSAAVWSASMLFFQLLLLAGYAYAHLSIRFATDCTMSVTTAVTNLTDLLAWDLVPNQAGTAPANPGVVSITGKCK